ncbi:hypothetical protein [Nostoc favosum]|nr:hypothetical protein [Nostoc favosum]
MISNPNWELYDVVAFFTDQLKPTRFVLGQTKATDSQNLNSRCKKDRYA